MKSTKHMFFVPGNICLDRIRRNPEASGQSGVVADQEIGEFVPLLYPDATMTDCPVRFAEHPAYIGIVEIYTVFVPEIKFYNAQRIVIAFPLFYTVREICSCKS